MSEQPRAPRERGRPLVDARQAEILARRFDAFGAGVIRECLEGETLQRAVKLLGRGDRLIESATHNCHEAGGRI